MEQKNKVLAGCTIVNMVGVTPMVYTVFGLFLIPISDEFAWPRSAVSAVLLVLAIVAAIAYPIIGRAIDRFGARRVMIPGIILFAASVALISLSPANPVIFYGLFALMGAAAAIPSTAMFTKVIAGWFDETRGFALGFAGGVGNGVGAAISPIIVAALIASFGWRGAFNGVALIVLAVGLPTLLLLLRDPPRSASTAGLQGTGMTLQEAMATRTFWILLVAVGLGAGCMTAVFAHVVPMLLDRAISMDRAVTVLVTFSTVTAAWQIGIGLVLDRFPRPWIAAPFYVAAMVGLIALARSDAQPVLILAGALMGLGLGTEYGVLPYLLSRYFGVRHYGAISGVAYGVIVLVQGITPPLMDLDYDVNGSYDVAVTVIAIAMIVGAGLLLMLRPLDRPIDAHSAPAQ
ncbi:MAG: MFS transporter [Pseudomonadota bacterium]